jgi:hypothetical protein
MARVAPRVETVEEQRIRICRRALIILVPGSDRRECDSRLDSTFLPAIRRFVEDGLSYNEVKRSLKIPSTWGAKISGAQFRERTTD